MTARRLLKALAPLALAGCGYGFAVGPGVSTVAHGRRIAVGAFENESTEPTAALAVQRDAARSLAARGLAGGGSLALEGTIRSVDAVPVGVVGVQDVQLWRARATVELRLVDGSHPGARLVARSVVTLTEDYRPGADIEATEAARELATARLLERCVDAGLDGLAPAPD